LPVHWREAAAPKMRRSRGVQGLASSLSTRFNPGEEWKWGGYLSIQNFPENARRKTCHAASLATTAIDASGRRRGGCPEFATKRVQSGLQGSRDRLRHAFSLIGIRGKPRWQAARTCGEVKRQLLAIRGEFLMSYLTTWKASK